MKGVDSAARFSAAAAKAAGYDIGCRYVNQTFTRAELDDYNANGLILLPIYEESGKPGSYADGQRQGTNALRLLTALGLPTYGCAFTDDVSGAAYPVVREWVRGIRSTFPNHVVFYGPNFIGDQLVDEGLADSVWIEGAFSYSRPYVPGQAPTARHACGIQYPPPYAVIGGVTCDRNDFYSTPWVPGSTTTPTTPTGDWFDMATLDDLKAALQDDAVLSAIARKVREELNGTLDAERAGRGEPQGRGPNLGAVVRTLTENHADAPTIKDNVERIVNATGAHS